MTITHDFIEDSTAPMWTDEQRAALLADQLAELIHVLDSYQKTFKGYAQELPFYVLDVRNQAERVLREVNGL
jgi:hypothetical protein